MHPPKTYRTGDWYLTHKGRGSPGRGVHNPPEHFSRSSEDIRDPTQQWFLFFYFVLFMGSDYKRPSSRCSPVFWRVNGSVTSECVLVHLYPKEPSSLTFLSNKIPEALYGGNASARRYVVTQIKSIEFESVSSKRRKINLSSTKWLKCAENEVINWVWRGPGQLYWRRSIWT